MPNLQIDSLRRHVSVATFERGRALWRSRRVCGPGKDALGPRRWQLHGEVQGSEAWPYETGALIELAADGAVLEFKGDCSCPVGFDCKHSVALVLSLMSQLAAPDPDSERLVRWLGRLRTDPPVAPSADQPIYLLRDAPLAPGTGPRLSLGWALAHPLKRGGWSKPRAPGYGSEHWLAALAPDAPGVDRDCVQLIRSLAASGFHQSPGAAAPLTGETGLLALRLAASTGRLFYVEAKGAIVGAALRWGSERPLGWQWRESIDPRGGELLWTLVPTLAVQAADLRLYGGPPALYLDLQSGEVGSLQAAQLAPRDLALLFEAPPMPASVFADPRHGLLERLAGLPLPPTVAAPLAWPVALPQAVLSLVLRPAQEREERGLVSARLSFDYAGLRGHWPRLDTRQLVEHEGQQVLLTRDLGAEHGARVALVALGLEADPMPDYAGPSSQWLAWAAAQWQPLREAGFVIEAGPELTGLVQTADALSVRLDEADAERGDGAEPSSPWFDLSLGIEIDGQRQDVLPWLPGLLGQVQMGPEGPVLPEWLWRELPDGRWLRLASAPLQPWLAALLELVGEREPREAGIRLSRVEALRLTASLGEGAHWDGAGQLRSLLGQLAGGRLPEVEPPQGLATSLRPYQQRGLDWLQFLRAQGLGGVLADDMGLGKTVQTLAHLLCEQRAGRLDRPCLVIAPVSLLGNWRREAERFAPSLRVRIWHGGQRHGAGFAQDCDLLIAPYSLLQRDRERWMAQPWHVVVLDEAQHIKNASTHAAQVASALQARQRIALTGTPMENHLGELWSLFHCLLPGLLGSQARFARLFRTPIEKQGLAEPLQRLRRRVTPFMLRRTKEAVASELPPRIESILPVTLAGAQADLYETIRLATEKSVRDALAERGLARSQIIVLEALLKLRQVCCDPRLVKSASARQRGSAKLELLMELLAELLSEGRRVLVFSQFTSMLSLIEAELKAAGHSWTKLTGQTQRRDDAIARFTSGEAPLFLISLKAGGTGLNLPQADTVIHYDPWWNPAVQAQATARAHRIGQTRQVMVYQLVAEGTLEERMLALQARKAALAQGLLAGAAAREQPLFTEEDLAELLKPLGA